MQLRQLNPDTNIHDIKCLSARMNNNDNFDKCAAFWKKKHLSSKTKLSRMKRFTKKMLSSACIRAHWYHSDFSFPSSCPVFDDHAPEDW